MSRPVWPSNDLPAPKPLADGFGMTFPNAAISTPMERGAPKERLLTTAPVENVQMSLRVDAAGLARFRRFYIEETRYGIFPFLMRDGTSHGQPLSNNLGEVLTNGVGQPLTIAAWWIAKFVSGEPPQVGDNNGRWLRVTFQLLILP